MLSRSDNMMSRKTKPRSRNACAVDAQTLRSGFSASAIRYPQSTIHYWNMDCYRNRVAPGVRVSCVVEDGR